MFSLPEQRRPSAFYAIADNLAVRIQLYAIRSGLKVPEDFSIIGVGASEIGKYAMTTLTTMDENLQTYGINAVKILLGNADNLPISEQNVCRVQASMVIRKSTGPCKDADKK